MEHVVNIPLSCGYHWIPVTAYSWAFELFVEESRSGRLVVALVMKYDYRSSCSKSSNGMKGSDNSWN